MKVEIKRLGILRTGIILAALYGFLAVIIIPIMIIAFFASPQEEKGQAFGMLCMFVMYPVMGFIGGILMAALYNLIVRFVGGMQLELDVEPVGPYNPVPDAGPSGVYENGVMGQ